MGPVPRGRLVLSAPGGADDASGGGAAHPEGGFFGELYLRSTLPFLSAATTAAEVRYLERAFAPPLPPGPVADLGCGTGRHAAPLQREGALAGRVVGLERDAASLAQRLAGFPLVRADLRALPFAPASLAGAYAWYSTLFVFSDEEHLALLADVARCVRPGGRLVVQTAPFERLAATPHASFRTALPDGSLLEERSHFDAASGWDRAERRLTAPDGRRLVGRYAIRYYPVAQLAQMLESTGFSLRWVHGGLAGEPLTPTSTDLILGAERRHGRDG